MRAACDILGEDVTEKPVTVSEAARALNVTPKTIRKWLRDEDGPPCERPGRRGPGRGALVYVSDLVKWRAQRAGIDAGTISDDRLMTIIADACLESHRCGALLYEGQPEVCAPLHEIYRVPPQKAALLTAGIFDRVQFKVTGKLPDQTLYESIIQLRRIGGNEP